MAEIIKKETPNNVITNYSKKEADVKKPSKSADQIIGDISKIGLVSALTIASASAVLHLYANRKNFSRKNISGILKNVGNGFKILGEGCDFISKKATTVTCLVPVPEKKESKESC